MAYIPVPIQMRFPRLRGDEPVLTRLSPLALVFSPPTRG